MTDTPAPAAQEAAPGPIDYQPPAITQEALSIDDAMRMWTEEPKKPEAESAEPEAATAEPESPKESADPETDPGEQPEAAEPAEELPPIEPPRSWTKEAKDRWDSLPRETQEYLAQREQERDRGLRQSQNEIAEQRKAIEAERAKAEQVRKDYEAKLPTLVSTLEAALQNEFGDIKDLNDVRKLQMEDPFRFQQWQLRQMELGDAQKKQQEAERLQAEERQASRLKYAQEQESKLHELIPEMKDPAKANELRTKAVHMLIDDYGFSESELGDIMQTDAGHKLLNDARWQKLIADGLKYRDLKSAPPKAAPKTLPPVQRPGAKQPSGAAQAQSIQALNQKLNATGSLDDAFALLMAQRKAS